MERWKLEIKAINYQKGDPNKVTAKNQRLRIVMADSCFELFRVKCFRKSSITSRESIFQIDKSVINENVLHDKKSDNFANSLNSIGGDKRATSDKRRDDIEYHGLKSEPDVVLRRHNRFYLRSISATSSNDALSSDEDDSENLDILFPLPRVNTYERSLSEEANRQVVDINNGTAE